MALAGYREKSYVLVLTLIQCVSGWYEISIIVFSIMKLGERMMNNIESNSKSKNEEAETTPSTPRYGNPLVSAIITTHNREPCMVLRAVTSVLNQTYQNIELIVVDDSLPSFAQRAEVEQTVCSISDDILYLKNEFCQGACAARNVGLSHAKGYYVGFLDDDDEWMPTKIEEQLKGFFDDNTALVYSQIIVIDDENHTEHLGTPRHESGYIFEKLLKRNYIGSTSNPLIKRECIETVGYFDVQMESCQDYDLWLRLALRYPIQYINAPLLRYHVHSGKRISTDDEKRIKGIERIISKYADYFNEDKDAWCVRCFMLVPHYQKLFGRKKALALWISCVKKNPGNFSVNFKRLVMIILGIDKSTRLATLYYMLRGNRHV